MAASNLSKLHAASGAIIAVSLNFYLNLINTLDLNTPSSMSTRPAHIKRPSEPAAPKPPTKIHSLALIADSAKITGSHLVEVGENSVLHPHSQIKADGGRVVIGRNCTVSEGAVIIGDGHNDVIIDDGVNIEGGAFVQAKSIGDGTVVEVRARIGRGAVVGKHCKITPMSVIRPDEELLDYTVVYADNKRRLDQTAAMHPEVREARLKAQKMQVDLMKKLIPDASAKWR